MRVAEIVARKVSGRESHLPAGKDRELIITELSVAFGEVVSELATTPLRSACYALALEES